MVDLAKTTKSPKHAKCADYVAKNAMSQPKEPLGKASPNPYTWPISGVGQGGSIPIPQTNFLYTQDVRGSQTLPTDPCRGSLTPIAEHDYSSPPCRYNSCDELWCR